MTSTAEDLLAGEVIRPLRREEYEQLVALGAFDEEQVELLYGEIVEMPPQGPLHHGVIDLLHERLTGALGLTGRARIRVQGGAHSEPRPPSPSRTSPSSHARITAPSIPTAPT